MLVRTLSPLCSFFYVYVGVMKDSCLSACLLSKEVWKALKEDLLLLFSVQLYHYNSFYTFHSHRSKCLHSCNVFHTWKCELGSVAKHVMLCVNKWIYIREETVGFSRDYFTTNIFLKGGTSCGHFFKWFCLCEGR